MSLDSFFGKDHNLLAKKDIALILLILLLAMAITKGDNITFNETLNVTSNATTNATNVTGPKLNAEETIVNLSAGFIGTLQNLLNLNISQTFGLPEGNFMKVVAGISLLFTAWKLNGMIRWIADNLQTLMIIVGIYLILTGIGFLGW